MKLIRELTEEVKCLEEADASGKKHLYISGVFLQAGVTNRNGRVYPPPVLEREVARYVKEKIHADHGSCAYGELGHPAGPQVNPDRISHVITELKQQGNNWLGKARVIDEGMGKIVRGVLEAGGRWGISSRGLGTLRKDDKLGANIVNDDYRLMVGGDIVTDPSAPDAWLSGIMEGAEWFLDEASGEWRQRVVERARQDARKASGLTPERKAAMFEGFISAMAAAGSGQRRVDRLAAQAGVSPGRVRELWERLRANHPDEPATTLAERVRSLLKRP